MRHLIIILFLWSSFPLLSQDPDLVNPKLLTDPWDAYWVDMKGISPQDYGVYIFRNTFEIANVPNEFVVNITADNRYRLLVNGVEVSMGPARSDLQHWRYETVDISEYLITGKNVLAAEVYNMGIDKSVAQHSHRTAFLLQCNSEGHEYLNTGSGNWKVARNMAFTPNPVKRGEHIVGGYYAAGPCDNIDGKIYPWGWQTLSFDDSQWQAANKIAKKGAPRGFRYEYWWLLEPRKIPLLEQKEERLNRIVRSEGIEITNSEQFINPDGQLTIQGNQTVTILLDQAHLTMGFPELLVSNGKGSKITVTYSEALYDKETKQKGNRNETEGKRIYGYQDVFFPDGGENRLFRPLWIRTYRYIQLNIETQSDPLVLNDYYGIFTAYPLEQKGSFESNDPSLTDIWNTGWRTARLCALETYFDCPYYEQLNYVGDTRIQALISMYASGDDRLVRNAIVQFDNSRMSNGLTMARYPSDLILVIPPFSLFWIDMIHDYHLHRDDRAFVKQFLPGIRGVLSWFEKYIDETGMLGNVNWWNYTDWSPEYPGGTPPGAADGNSANITLQYAYALYYAANLMEDFGYQYEADQYRRQASELKKATLEHCWSDTRALLSETPDQKVFSQHTNIWAILTDAVPIEAQKPLLTKILTEPDLVKSTIYFRYYLFEAMQKVGIGDKYLEQLKPWHTMLKNGLSTFQESDIRAFERSDCHAWSASPNYHLLATVCGIRPVSYGFKSVEIAPNLGGLEKIKGTYPDPRGNVIVDLERKGKTGILGKVTLPVGMSGVFKWHGSEIALQEGEQNITFKK